MILGIVELYHGASGKNGFYNSQEIGLARAMKKIGYSAIIFYPKAGAEELEEEQVEADIKIIYVPAKTVGVHAKYDWNVLFKYSVEVVQVGSDNQIFAPGLLRFCDKNHLPVYNFIGTTGSDSGNKLKRLLMRFIYQNNIKAYKTHKCFAKTDFVRQGLSVKGIQHVEVASVGLDTSTIPSIMEDKNTIRMELGLTTDAKILLFVGRIDGYKCPLDAIVLLKKLPAEYFLVIIGSGTLNDCLGLEIAKLDEAFDSGTAIEGRMLKQNVILTKRVLWIKKLPNAQIHQYYKISDFYLNFNRNEIFGMSILEAMYQGSTVIANHAPGPDSIIEDKISGYLVSELEEMIQIIVSGKKLNEKTVRNRITTYFVWEKTARIFDEWIKKLV